MRTDGKLKFASSMLAVMCQLQVGSLKYQKKILKLKCTTVVDNSSNSFLIFGKYRLCRNT